MNAEDSIRQFLFRIKMTSGCEAEECGTAPNKKSAHAAKFSDTPAFDVIEIADFYAVKDEW